MMNKGDVVGCLLVVLAASCGDGDGPVTAAIGAASFSARSSASYFAGSKFFGFTAVRESDELQIEVRVEGLEAEGVGIFEAGPTQPHEILLVDGSKTQSTRGMGLGTIEIDAFTLEIDRDTGVGEGRATGKFEAELDGIAISRGRFDIPVFSGDICNQNVEARAAFDCP